MWVGTDVEVGAARRWSTSDEHERTLERLIVSFYESGRESGTVYVHVRNQAAIQEVFIYFILFF